MPVCHWILPSVGRMVERWAVSSKAYLLVTDELISQDTTEGESLQIVAESTLVFSALSLLRE